MIWDENDFYEYPILFVKYITFEEAEIDSAGIQN